MNFPLPTPLNLLMEIKARYLNKPPILFDKEMENVFNNKFNIYYYTEPLDYERVYPYMCVIEVLDGDVVSPEELKSYNKWVNSFNKLAKSLDTPVVCEIVEEMRHVFEDYSDLLDGASSYDEDYLELEHRIIIKTI